MIVSSTLFFYWRAASQSRASSPFVCLTWDPAHTVRNGSGWYIPMSGWYIPALAELVDRRPEACVMFPPGPEVRGTEDVWV